MSIEFKNQLTGAGVWEHIRPEVQKAIEEDAPFDMWEVYDAYMEYGHGPDAPEADRERILRLIDGKNSRPVEVDARRFQHLVFTAAPSRLFQSKDMLHGDRYDWIVSLHLQALDDEALPATERTKIYEHLLQLLEYAGAARSKRQYHPNQPPRLATLIIALETLEHRTGTDAFFAEGERADALRAIVEEEIAECCPKNIPSVRQAIAQLSQHLPEWAPWLNEALAAREAESIFSAPLEMDIPDDARALFRGRALGMNDYLTRDPYELFDPTLRDGLSPQQFAQLFHFIVDLHLDALGNRALGPERAARLFTHLLAILRHAEPMLPSVLAGSPYATRLDLVVTALYLLRPHLEEGPTVAIKAAWDPSDFINADLKDCVPPQGIAAYDELLQELGDFYPPDFVSFWRDALRLRVRQRFAVTPDTGRPQHPFRQDVLTAEPAELVTAAPLQAIVDAHLEGIRQASGDLAEEGRLCRRLFTLLAEAIAAEQRKDADDSLDRSIVDVIDFPRTNRAGRRLLERHFLAEIALFAIGKLVAHSSQSPRRSLADFTRERHPLRGAARFDSPPQGKAIPFVVNLQEIVAFDINAITTRDELSQYERLNIQFRDLLGGAAPDISTPLQQRAAALGITGIPFTATFPDVSRPVDTSHSGAEAIVAHTRNRKPEWETEPKATLLDKPEELLDVDLGPNDERLFLTIRRYREIFEDHREAFRNPAYDEQDVLFLFEHLVAMLKHAEPFLNEAWKRANVSPFRGEAIFLALQDIARRKDRAWYRVVPRGQQFLRTFVASDVRSATSSKQIAHYNQFLNALHARYPAAAREARSKLRENAERIGHPELVDDDPGDEDEERGRKNRDG